jgi:ADP-heptose:LPS heptosyltransferase
MKFLVITFAGIGDTLFATPLIHELRASHPGARIDVLVRWKGAAGLLEGNPHLNTVFQRDLVKIGMMGSLKFLFGLRRVHYDVSFNTHPQSRIHYRAVARLVNARLRASHQYECSGALDRLLVNRSLPQDYTRHAIENNLALLGLIGGKPVLPAHEYELFLTPAETGWAEAFIQKNGLATRTRLGIHVGSGGTKNLALRRWPLQSYLALFRKLAQASPQTAVLLFGGPEEEKDHAAILAQTDRNQVFVTQTANLRQAAALLKTCDAFLSVDTALMHLAAAMKVPNQFVIETPTWNKPIEPFGNPFTLIPNSSIKGRHLEFYRYDGRGIQGSDEELIRCMASVSVDEVLAALTAKLPRST